MYNQRSSSDTDTKFSGVNCWMGRPFVKWVPYFLRDLIVYFPEDDKNKVVPFQR